MDLMERKFRRCLRGWGGANVHGFFSRYAAERSGRTETLTSRTAADETASTSTASASRSQRTARKSFALSSVGRSLCTRFSSPLTSAHARRKRDAPHEETSGLASRAFGDSDIRPTEKMVVCLEILVCATGSSKVDAFTAQVSERPEFRLADSRLPSSPSPSSPNEPEISHGCGWWQAH